MARSSLKRFSFILGVILVVSFYFAFGPLMSPPGSGPTTGMFAAVARHLGLPGWRRAGPHGNTSSSRNIPVTDPRPALDSLWACADGKPRDHLVYVKTHKTGSSTLSHIIGRYGYTRKLSFALKKDHPVSGHFMNDPVVFGMQDSLLPPLRCRNCTAGNATLKHDIMNLHIRFNRTVMDSFMALPTRYITTLRDPGYQFESGFVHFNLANVMPSEVREGCNASNACLMERFLQRADHYWGLIKPPRWFWAKNNLVYDMGLDHEHHANRSAVSSFIGQLHNQLDLVLITDYYDESLLLLRKLMCWDWHDILYIAENVRTTKVTLSEQLRNQIREWNSVDMQMYRHFNRTLWDRIEQYGPSFRTDLEQFRRMRNETLSRCIQEVDTQKGPGRGYRILYHNVVRANASTDCKLIAKSSFEGLIGRIWSRQKSGIAI